MTNPESRGETAGGEPTASGNADLSRAAQHISAHLATLGIDLSDAASADTVREVSEAVERFEEAVRARGGDLMVDEAPRGEKTQPDDPDFALPRPNADEGVAAYVERLRAATSRVLQHPRQA